MKCLDAACVPKWTLWGWEGPDRLAQEREGDVPISPSFSLSSWATEGAVTPRAGCEGARRDAGG